MQKNTLHVAIAGNPNSGKTTIFNDLTGARQKVGNYPGVTVEKKTGYIKTGTIEIKVVDLPGIYSLTAVSEEEVVARNYIIEREPDVVVDIIDSSNLERNLYLAVQLMEMGRSMVLALNMYDVAQHKGISIDFGKLSKLLNIPIVSTVGHKGKGIDLLKKAILEAGTNSGEVSFPKINYGRELEQFIGQLRERLDLSGKLSGHKRWVAIKLLENDAAMIRRVRGLLGEDNEIWGLLDSAQKKLSKLYGDSPEALIADRRYGFISGVVQESTKVSLDVRHDISDHVDAIVTHPLLGLPLFLALMYGVFYFTFTLGELPMEWIEKGFAILSGFIESFWPAGSESALRSLVTDGIIGGVGGVVVFLPNILLLFLGIAILEDTGYMARAAFIMDRFMHKIGLHGKSFIPMLIGFGCSVPAIMGTRILENKRDRLTTIMIIPLMSCGARLTIYSLLIPAFFSKDWQAPMLWIIYVIGIFFAVVLAKILRVFVFKGDSVGLVMELPPYRMPTVKGLAIHMWQRGWMYLRKAGTVILTISVILWALTSYPKLPAKQASQYNNSGAKIAAALKYSAAGRIGHVLAKVTSPLGFDWKVSTALVGALAAKEVFVSQLGIMFTMGKDVKENSETLREKLHSAYTPLQAFCIMLFSLLSAPCIATFAISKKESGSWTFALSQFFGLTLLAYLVTLIVYQAGMVIL